MRVESEAVLGGEDAADGGAGGADPPADLGLERVPLEALDVTDAEALDAEPAQGGVDRGLADGRVHLRALAAVLGGGLLFGRSFIAVMFDQMFNLTPQGWRILTMRWALFFAGMAILNEIVWRTQTTDFWVNFKVFGVTPLTMIFAIAQMPLTKRYHLEPVSLETSEADAGDLRK